MNESGRYERDYIVVLVCGDASRHRFWSAGKQDWTTDLNEATIYPTYGDSAHAIWNIPEAKVTHRITSSNRTLYELYSSGKWDGRSKLPDGY